MNEKNKSTEKILEESERLDIAVRIINTHRYWTPLIIFKIDIPSEREIKLESYDYVLPNIRYKDCDDYKKLVIRAFYQKMREKYKHRTGYSVAPILLCRLCLEKEEAEKIMEDMKGINCRSLSSPFTLNSDKKRGLSCCLYVYVQAVGVISYGCA